MAGDNRDWYRDWWNKKTGYVERASFRMSEEERTILKLRARIAERERMRDKSRADSRRNWLLLAAIVAFIAAIAIGLRL